MGCFQRELVKVTGVSAQRSSSSASAVVSGIMKARRRFLVLRSPIEPAGYAVGVDVWRRSTSAQNSRGCFSGLGSLIRSACRLVPRPGFQ